MTTLVVQIPPRPRVGAPATASGDPALGITANFFYAFSQDGITVSRHGHATRDLLPRAETVIAVLPEAEVSWHRLKIPKVPASRMSAVLGNMLEDAVLEDVERLHFSLPAQWQAGDDAWVAVTNKAWVTSALGVLEPKLRIDRIVPMMTPEDRPWCHFHDLGLPDGSTTSTCLTWASAEGVASWPLKGGLAHVLLPQPLPSNILLTSSPAAAAPAERWLNTAVQVLSHEEHLVLASRSLWNLRQFDLAPRHRGLEALAIQGQRFMGPRWRAFRFGAIGLIALQIVGLNLWAWAQKNVVAQRSAAMTQLLRETYPQITVIHNAPLQMSRETDLLRTAAGEGSDEDLEMMLKTAASAWPTNDPIQTLQYEPGRLTIAIPRWTQAQVDQLRATLKPSGWHVEAQSGHVTLSTEKSTPKQRRPSAS
jgi:general secretion pathway protein L